jgi:hypothetical protein
MNQLERQVLQLLGEEPDSPDVFTDTDAGLAPVREALNDAIAELCLATGHYRRRYYLATLAERSLYRLAPQQDYLGWVIGAIDRETKRPLTQSDYLAVAAYDPYWLQRNGPPEYYWQMGVDVLGLYPRPSAKGRLIELDMICVPKPYIYDTQPIDLRAQWQQAAVWRAVADLHAMRGDAGRATEYFSRYLEMAQLMGLHPEHNERQYQLGGYQRWQRGQR